MRNSIPSDSFAIGIPTINQWEFLKPQLEKYFVDFPMIKIYLLDNGHQAIDLDHINLIKIKSPLQRSVSESWNFLCQIIFSEHEYALLLNDDIYLGLDYSNIADHIDFVKKNDIALLLSTKDWCVVLLPETTYSAVGIFDENFKGAYFEDRDYERRIKLHKQTIGRFPALNPKIYNESMSIKEDPRLNANYQKNASYYKLKWGGNLGGEKYFEPFNGQVVVYSLLKLD